MMVNEAGEAFDPVVAQAIRLTRSGVVPVPVPDVTEIANRIFVQNRPTHQQTEITLRFIDEDIRRMDRQAFRQHVSERLNAAGDALMRLWEESQP